MFFSESSQEGEKTRQKLDIHLHMCRAGGVRTLKPHSNPKIAYPPLPKAFPSHLLLLMLLLLLLLLLRFKAHPGELGQAYRPHPLGLKWGLAGASSTAGTPTRDRASFLFVISASPALSACHAQPHRERGREEDSSWEREEIAREERSEWAWWAVLFKVVVYDSYTNLYKDMKAFWVKNKQIVP